jgi:hypothetical protein
MLACCGMNDPVKPAVSLQRLQVKTFDDDVFPTVSRTIFAGRPYDRGALTPVLRAVTALMLLQQTKLETLKIGRANDRMRLRSGFRNALMLRLSSEGKGRPASTRPVPAFNLTPSTLAATGHENECFRSRWPDQPRQRRRTQPLRTRSAEITHIMAHARPTACMTRKSADGIACVVVASAACRASTSARRFGSQPQGQPPSERC